MAHVLIVDDEDVLRDLLSQILENMGHTCDQAASGEEGIEQVANKEYDLIVTDIRMPGISGIDFLRRIQPRVESRTPCMIITALADEPSIAVKAVRLACDFLSKPFELSVVKDAVKRALKLREAWVFRRNYAQELEHALHRLESELRETYDGVLIGFAAMIEGKDGAQDEADDAAKVLKGTQMHCQRVIRSSVRLARELGVVDEVELRNIELGAMLHDVGKYRIPDRILWKKGPLTDDEWKTMRKHPEDGAEFVREIPFLAGAADLILSHHERWDGGGYPRGLRGEEICLPARLFAVADAFDAMTSPRCYRDPVSPAAARDELLRHRGTQFDPKVVDAFVRILPEILEDQGARPPRLGPPTNGRSVPGEGRALEEVALDIRRRVAEETRTALG